MKPSVSPPCHGGGPQAGGWCYLQLILPDACFLLPTRKSRPKLAAPNCNR
jgi:hypothetical protein